MEKKIIETNLIEKIGEYGIVKCKEQALDHKGKSIGKVQTWYDVCLEHGEGDIVASFKTKSEAKEYIREEVI